jgi:hypothetical protein
MGVHPVVYFYTRGGAFQPSAFLATSRFLEKLDNTNKLKQFVNIRRSFEDFLIARKEALGLIVHKFGSGGRHIPWLHVYYQRIADGLWNGRSLDEIWKALGDSKEFSFLAAPPESRLRDPNQKKGGSFSDSTKTASFFNVALPSAVRCELCGGLIHTNSIHTDHKVRRREQGGTDMKNAHPVHPYCDSIKN